MRNRLPMILAAMMIVLMAAAFFSPALKQAYGTPVNSGLQIFAAFAVIPAVVSLLRLHTQRLRRGNWYSIVTVLAFVVSLVLGFVDNDPKLSGPMFGWVFRNMLDPLQRAIFAFLAFFIASAAYRAFRARTMEATLLLIAAVIVMVGNAIVALPGPGAPLELWLLNVPALAMQRGIILGAALGVIAQSVRILLGLERGLTGR